MRNTDRITPSQSHGCWYPQVYPSIGCHGSPMEASCREVWATESTSRLSERPRSPTSWSRKCARKRKMMDTNRCLYECHRSKDCCPKVCPFGTVLAAKTDEKHPSRSEHTNLFDRADLNTPSRSHTNSLLQV